jgi:hypothetical protein
MYLLRCKNFTAVAFVTHMAYFQIKNLNLGKLSKVLQWKMIVYFMAIWSIYCHLVYFVVIRYILSPIGIFCGYLVYFVANWYILWLFGIFCGHLVYFVDIWNILWTFGIFCGHLVYFVAIWYILSPLVYLVANWYILWLHIWYILLPFGIFYGYLVHFSRFGMLQQENLAALLTIVGLAPEVMSSAGLDLPVDPQLFTIIGDGTDGGLMVLQPLHNRGTNETMGRAKQLLFITIIIKKALQVETRVARVFLEQHTKTARNIPNNHKM